jgi:hypothetical protein
MIPRRFRYYATPPTPFLYFLMPSLLKEMKYIHRRKVYQQSESSAIITLTKVNQDLDRPGQAGADLVVSREMIDAGAEILEETFSFGRASADYCYIASRVYRAMRGKEMRLSDGMADGSGAKTGILTE